MVIPHCKKMVKTRFSLSVFDGIDIYSMGGSVAVHIAANKTLPSLAGLVIVDVVEVCFMIEKSHLS